MTSACRTSCVRSRRSAKSTTPRLRFSSSRKAMKRVASACAATAARGAGRRSMTASPLAAGRRARAVDDGFAAVAGSQLADGRGQHGLILLARQLLRPDGAGDGLEIIDPGVEAGAEGWRVEGHVTGDGLRLSKRMDDVECTNEVALHFRHVAHVVAAIEQQVAPLYEREEDLANEKQVPDVLDERLPLPQRLGRRRHARLLIDPCVVQLGVEQRALEALDDLELRVEFRFQRELAEQRLAEGVDRLRAETVDACELARAGCTCRLTLRRRDLKHGRGGADRPRDDAVLIDARPLDARRNPLPVVKLQLDLS